jgi:hypothetical protein
MSVLNENTIIGASAAGTSDYEIEQSLRFNDDDSAYLSRTPSITGNRKTWTWSGWVKRGNLGTSACVVSAGNTGNVTGITILQFSSNDTLNFYTHSTSLDTTRVFRDPSAWYHIVWAVDSTQATDSNRSKIYINGEQITDLTGTYPVLNWESAFNLSGYTEEIGRYSYNNTRFFDGYLSEVNFVEGQALTPSNFGKFGIYGEWKPIAYTGAYGTNGFYLDFKDSGSLGNDAAGSNNWTLTNLAATDQMLDSPTNNFAVMNPLSIGAGIVLSEGNTKHVTTTNGTSLSSIGMGTGKWYAEALHISGTYFMAGIAIEGVNSTAYLGSDGYGWGYYYNGNKYNSGSISAYGAAFTTGDIVGISFDANVGEVIFYKNGVSQGVAYTGLSSDDYFFAMGANQQNSIINFGQDSSFAGNKTAQDNQDSNGIGDFYYAPPTGFLAVCTQNLPDATVIPSEHFNTVLYTGNNSTHAVTGVGFAPDFTWIKSRSGSGVSYANTLLDTIRGARSTLFSNESQIELVRNSITSFDSDGFTTFDYGATNASGQTYVAWNWKANGAGVSNTDGTITSTVSANVDAGFSIVSWTATSSAKTVGHGLSVAPSVIILKNRTTAANWAVFNTATNSHKLSYLNLTNTQITPGESAPTSSIFNVGQTSATTGTSGHNMIAYCFHNVDSYSRVGSYTGNGSATAGPFVHCGFRPAYMMIKSVDSTHQWHILDDKRSPENIVDKYFNADGSSAELTYSFADFTANGIKIRNNGASINTNGGTYIFLAFAESPFKHSNAR